MDKVLSAAEAAACAGRSCKPQGKRLRYPDNKHLSKKVAHTFLNLGKVKAVLTVPVEKLNLQMDESTHVLMVALLEASLHSQVGTAGCKCPACVNEPGLLQETEGPKKKAVLDG